MRPLRHPLIAFFALACALSWGSLLVLSRPTLFPFGPFVAALLVAGYRNGWSGIRQIVSRCLQWRARARWYLAALLVPLAVIAASVALNVLLGATMVDTASGLSWYGMLLLIPAAALDAPLWEEAGWRGFAFPEFPRGTSTLRNTLLLAALVAGWHLPLALATPAIAAPYLIGSFASGIVTNWIYSRAGGSALLAILFHSTQNGLATLCFRDQFQGAAFVHLWWIYAGVFAATALLAGRAIRR